jgi:RecQ family ATP-dependent DNA helicase
MFTVLKSIDASLWNKYEDVEKNIKASSRTVYVSMQSFAERLLKYIAKENNFANIDSTKSTLGSLLGNQALIKFIEYRLYVEDVYFLDEINTLSNEYKHGQTFVIRENELERLFENLCELIDGFIVYKNKKSDAEKPFKNRFQELLNFYDNKKADVVHEEIVKKALEDNQVLAEEKARLEKQLNVLIDKQQSILSAKEIRKQIDQQVTQHHEDIANLKNKNSEIDKRLAELTKKRKTGTITEEEHQENVLLYDQMTENIRTIDQLENGIAEYNAMINKDQQAIQITNYEVLIQEQENKIRELNEKLESNVANVSSINKGTYKSNYNDRSIQYEKIRNLYARTKFNSSYLEYEPFEITNITLTHKPESKFSSLYGVVFNLLVRSETIQPIYSLRTFNNLEINEIYRYQILVLSLVKEGLLNDSLWSIRFPDNIDEPLERIRLFTAACEATFELVKKIAILAKINYQAPILTFDEKLESTIYVDLEDEIHEANHFGILRNNVYGDGELSPLWIDKRINYKIDPNNNEHIKELNYFLWLIFGFKSFREGQIEIIANFLNGRNTIGVLPTGAGKSLTYYFSVMLQPKISLVIAPILALMKDQTDKLIQFFKFKSVTTISSQSDNNDERISEFKQAKYMFTLVSPERLQNEKFRNALIKLNSEESIGSIILDEVHCLSEWGHDFRPSYLMLSSTLNDFARNAKYLGLTATASINVVKDVMVELHIRSGKDVKFVKKLKRENLDFKIIKTKDEDLIAQNVKDLLIDNIDVEDSEFNVDPNGTDSNCGIVFCTTKSQKKATGSGKMYNELLPYFGNHLGIFDGDNKSDQDPFMNNEKTLLIATKAFGMGIDKPNIRFTIHAGMPASREGFYQEAGRAGRDNKPSKCILISGNYDDGSNKSSLIQEFLSLRTSITRLKEIAKMRAKETGYIDITTHFYFMANEIDEPENERDQLVELYNDITEFVKLNNNNFIYPKRIFGGFNNDGGERSRVEKLLVQLHKLGVVNNYAIQYVDGGIVFNINIHHLFNDLAHLKEKSSEYLKSYDASNPLINQIQAIESLKEFPQLVLMLRRWYHDTFTRTKREQLANIHAFINRHRNSTSDQIQEELEQFFDLSGYFQQDEDQGEEYSDEDSIPQIIDKVFKVDRFELGRKIVATEFLIESIVNSRIDLYLSLLHLRNGESYLDDNNGKQRFEYALSNMSLEELRMVKEKMSQHYNSLEDQAKLSLLESFQKEKVDFNRNLKENHPNDEIYLKMEVLKIDQNLNSIMKGEK